MFLKNRFKLLKTAIIRTHINNKSWRRYIDAKNEISLLESNYNRPNPDLEAILGKEICEIKYCPEDWLGGSFQEESSETVVHKYPHFNGEKCEKTDCKALIANHAYFDSLNRFQTATKREITSWKRVFGIKNK